MLFCMVMFTAKVSMVVSFKLLIVSLILKFFRFHLSSAILQINEAFANSIHGWFRKWFLINGCEPMNLHHIKIFRHFSMYSFTGQTMSKAKRVICIQIIFSHRSMRNHHIN